MEISCFRCLRTFRAAAELLERGRRGKYIVWAVQNIVTCPNCGNRFYELLEEDQGTGAILVTNWPKVRDHVR